MDFSTEGSGVQIFHFFSCPGRFAQKGQAGFDAWVVFEAPDVDTIRQRFPTIVRQELFDDGL